MAKSRSILGISAALILSVWGSSPADQPQFTPQPGVLVLRTGRVLRGKISRVGDRYVVTLGGQEVEWGALDEDRCAAVYQVGTREYSPFLPEHVAEYIDTLMAEEKGAERSQMLSYAGSGPFSHANKEVPCSAKAWESYHHPSAVCGSRGCMRACMIHLEERGAIENTFENRFRIVTRRARVRFADIDATSSARARWPSSSGSVFSASSSTFFGWKIAL